MNVNITFLTPHISAGEEEIFHTHVYFVRPTYDSAPGSGIGAKTITANGEYHAGSDGLQGYGEVTVDVQGGGSATLIEKTVNANGVYNASSDSADGYSKVTVSVPASAVDTGTKSITANGTGIDVVGYAAVDVAVPNTYAAGDEGKVVSNGALVAQTAHAEVTQNGTIDTTLNNSVTVNVSGGGSIEKGYEALAFSSDNYVSKAKLYHSGNKLWSYACAGGNNSPWRKVSEWVLPAGLTDFSDNHVFYNAQALTSIELADATTIGGNTFYACNALTTVNLPKCETLSSTAFTGGNAWVTITIGSVGNACTSINSTAFKNHSTSDTITVYTTGAYAATALANIRNGAANATIVVKASENTTYGGNSYSAGDTIVTSTPT